MKRLAIPIVIVVSLIILFVIVDRRDFSSYDDIQNVQSKNHKSQRELPISAPRESTEEQLVFDTQSVGAMPSTKEKTGINPIPIAVPVLTREEAAQANKVALKYYNYRKIKSYLGDILLVVTSILCITVLMRSIRFNQLLHVHFLQVLDFVGWCIISFVLMYCVLLVFQINRPGYEFLTSLQPILSASSLHLYLLNFVLLFAVYIKVVLPFLLKCSVWKFFLIELFFSILIGGFVIHHFSIEPISDYKTLLENAIQWQTLPHSKVKELLSSPDLTGVLLRRCYFSYYMLYKVFGCKYIVIEFSQLFMHLALGVNVYFLAKQCVIHEKIARLSVFLYFLMPVQYLYLTIPSLDLWGGMLLCLNANLIIYLFKKSQTLRLYEQKKSSDFIQDSNNGTEKILYKVRSVFLFFRAYFDHIPWLFPLLLSILLGVTLFWMEMVRNLQLILCLPMFLFFSAVLVRRILARRMRLFSQTTLFICVLCLFVPFLTNKAVQKICDATPYGSDGVPAATICFNTPSEVRRILTSLDDYRLLPAERRKDLFLDAATSFWNLFPKNYSHYFADKIGCFSDLFNPVFVETTESIKQYSQEFDVYRFLIGIVKIFYMPLLLIGIFSILFLRRWNSLAFVPIILFFFFFFIMSTVGECQVRYTSLYYAPMCVCAASATLVINLKGHYSFRKKRKTQFFNSILWGTASIILFFFAVTSLFSSPSFAEKHQWINFAQNQYQISSGESPVAYKRYTERDYVLTAIFQPTVADVIPEKTYVEWIIPEQTTEGHEYMLYGFLIAPQESNADLVVKINGTAVWDNSAFSSTGRIYSNSLFGTYKEKIVFLDKLRFTAEKVNILRVEITPKSKESVDFGLSAWGMVPCK